MNEQPKQPRQMHLAEAVRIVTEAPPLKGWMDRAREMIVALAKTGEPFTAEELRRRVPNPPHLNCVGTSFKLAAEDGIIERVDFAKATGKKAHGRWVMVWRGKAPQ